VGLFDALRMIMGGNKHGANAPSSGGQQIGTPGSTSLPQSQPSDQKTFTPDAQVNGAPSSAVGTPMPTAQESPSNEESPATSTQPSEIAGSTGTTAENISSQEEVPTAQLTTMETPTPTPSTPSQDTTTPHEADESPTKPTEHLPQ
jgi:hypothetical protein